MDKQSARLAVLEHALKEVPFEGWNMRVLEHAAKAAGYSEHDAIRLFPAGASEAIAAFLADVDAKMLEAYAALAEPPQKVRERIFTLVRLRLEILSPHREVVRRTLAHFALPFHAGQGISTLARTVDAIWHAAGDRSTDFSWYTRRMLLSGVYGSTLLFWLNDESVGHAATHAFLERRIGNVMQIYALKAKLKGKP